MLAGAYLGEYMRSTVKLIQTHKHVRRVRSMHPYNDEQNHEHCALAAKQ